MDQQGITTVLVLPFHNHNTSQNHKRLSLQLLVDTLEHLLRINACMLIILQKKLNHTGKAGGGTTQPLQTTIRKTNQPPTITSNQ
jgi:hypothetical protein